MGVLLKTSFSLRGCGLRSTAEVVRLRGTMRSAPIAKSKTRKVVNQKPDLMVWGTVLPSLAGGHRKRDLARGEARRDGAVELGCARLFDQHDGDIRDGGHDRPRSRCRVGERHRDGEAAHRLAFCESWANRMSERTMGDHMEDTTKEWDIAQEAQDN